MILNAILYDIDKNELVGIAQKVKEIIALGDLVPHKNLCNQVIKKVLPYLKDKDIIIRYNTAIILGDLCDPIAIKPLEEALKNEDPRFTLSIEEAIRQIKSAENKEKS